MARTVPRIAFVMEQALGHVTYTRNLQTAFARDPRIAPTWLLAQYADGGPLDRLPITGRNWTIRGSLRGYAALRQRGGAKRFDAVVIHTPTVALATPLISRTTPVILSLDATPLGFDGLGHHYGHRADGAGVTARAKRALHTAMFRGAESLTTWSQWAKDSLVHDYGVAPDRVTVIAPGIDLALFPWGREHGPAQPERPIRVLFVGGDFERKGGRLLLSCMRAGLAGQCELDIVTRAPVPPTPGVRVHSDLGPNDPRLVRLYREADIFALPTYGDCLAVVLGEAMAAGLPIVTTSVAAQPEAVQDGRSGIIISPGDQSALGHALRRLIAEPSLRRDMGRHGRSVAEARFDARVNAGRLIDVIQNGIDRRRQARWGKAALSPQGEVGR